VSTIGAFVLGLMAGLPFAVIFAPRNAFARMHQAPRSRS
jgi:hypothetical protein